MSFNDLAKQGASVGRAIRIDVSTDAFSSITYRWGSHAGKLDESNDYSARLVSMAPLSRGFGNDRRAAPAVTELVLDNTDGALDTLVSRTSHKTNHKLRARIYVVLFDTVFGFTSSVFAKQIGEFAMPDYPTRDGANIRMPLSDDVLATLTAVIDLPTVGDFRTAWDVANTSKLILPGDVDPLTPIPLAFGRALVGAVKPMVVAYDSGSPGALRVIYLLRANGGEANGNAGAGNSRVLIEWDPATEGAPVAAAGIFAQIDGSTVARDITPRAAITMHNGAASASRPLWIRGSLNVSKHSKTWACEYIEVYPLAFYGLLSELPRSTPIEESPLITPVDQIFPGAGSYFSDNAAAGNLNALNQEAVPSGAFPFLYDPRILRLLTGRRLWVVYGTSQHACDALASLIDNYTVPAVARDPTSFTTLKTANPDPQCLVQGVFDGKTGADLRSIITEICQSSDLDCFFNWAGSLAMSGDYLSAIAGQTASLVDFPEHAIANVEDRIPSVGDRGYAANGFRVDGGQTYMEIHPGLGTQDDQVDPADRVIIKDLKASWAQSKQLVGRKLDMEARPRIRFTTDLRGFLLELGDYFTLTWTRGTVSVYAGDTFQCESIRYMPGTGEGDGDYLEIEAQWVYSTARAWPYLLDDQTLTVVVTDNSGTDVVRVTDSSSDITVEGTWNPISAGVQAGDILILQDTSLAATVFTRFRCLRITTVSADTLTISDSDLDFDAPTGTNVTQWTIVRGALTYSALAGVNYPNGTDIYGKCSSALTVKYSDDSTLANRLG